MVNLEALARSESLVGAASAGAVPMNRN